jgi:heme/copper-type cytochrome/quinol oxidase subunit 3
MNKKQFPFVALGIGLFTLLMVMKGSEPREDGTTIIPLLTLLIISEFAFFVTAVGAYLGIKQIQTHGVKPVNAIITLLCILLAVGFIRLGIVLWPFSS